MVEGEQDRAPLLRVLARQLPRRAELLGAEPARGLAGVVPVARAVEREQHRLVAERDHVGVARRGLPHPAPVRADGAEEAGGLDRLLGPDVVVARDDRELLRVRERAEQVRRPLELARLAGEGHVAGHDEVVDADLAEGVEQPLREASGVTLAVTCGEAVAGVATPVGDVEIADVADADDAGSRVSGADEGARMLSARSPGCQTIG